MLTEKDRRVAEALADAVMARILNAVQDDELADKVIATWGKRIDMTIGRGLRRLGFYVLIALVGIAAVKLDVLNKIGTLLGK